MTANHVYGSDKEVGSRQVGTGLDSNIVIAADRTALKSLSKVE